MLVNAGKKLGILFAAMFASVSQSQADVLYDSLVEAIGSVEAQANVSLTKG
jgi:hypothetical protein